MPSADDNPTGILDASLIVGAVPVVISVLGAAALLVLLFGLVRWGRRPQRWWTRTVPAVVLGTVAFTGFVALVVDDLWQPFPDPLPLRVLTWLAVVFLGGGLAVVGSKGAGRGAWVRAVPVLVLVVALSGMKINAFYSYYPTARDLLGLAAADAIALADVPAAPTVTQAPDVPLARTWRPPPDLPHHGRFLQADIPGTASGFAARPAWVYLPPAYLSARERPLLPVLVLVAGQPGGPQDWLVAGRLAAVMNRFAAAHGGLAPIVVVPDATGAVLANPLCLDSQLGNVETYLSRDVPDWIVQHLQTDANRRHWSIGGFSYGGTCALQLAVRAPQAYPIFLDISGQDEPSLGDHDSTVAAAFGGDQARFAAVNPIDVLHTRTFPTSAGLIAIGAEDSDYGPGAARVLAATRGAGMSTELLAVRGAHSWAVATTALAEALPWLCVRAGLMDAPVPAAAVAVVPGVAVPGAVAPG